MIHQSEIDDAVRYLENQSDRLAELEAAAIQADRTYELKKYKAYMQTSGTIAERTAQAECEPEVQASWELALEAKTAFKKEKIKREAYSDMIQIWRTQESSRRAGV